MQPRVPPPSAERVWARLRHLWRLLREGNFMQGCRGTGAPGDMEMQQQPFGHDLPASDVSKINFSTGCSLKLNVYFGVNKSVINWLTFKVSKYFGVYM
jgi:hypothetical protein